MRKRRERPPDEAGFTLIELLVVIIIIGLLAAIAIPIFLNQRARAYDSAAQSDLKALADTQELHMVDSQSFGSISDLLGAGEDVRASPGITISVVRFDSVFGYCLSAHHASSPNTFYWDSSAGGLQPVGSGGCPVTTTGTPGGSLTG